jgi:CBS domain-containing protein
MKISEIMTPAAVTDQPSDTLAQAAHKMWEQQTGSLLVLEGQRVIGIITERDILKAVAQAADLKVVTIADAMAKDPVTCHASTSLREAARLMTDNWIRHLPVVEQDRLVGIVSQRDLSGVLAGALNEPDALQQLVEASQLTRDKRLKRIEKGVWD